MKKKKILIIGSKENYTLEKMYYRAFSELNHKIKFLNIESAARSKFQIILEKLFTKIIYSSLRKKILNFLNKNNNFELIIIFKGLYLNKSFLLSLKNQNPKTKIINIFTDDPLNTKYKNISNENIIECLENFDLFCIYSKKILKKIKKLKKKSKLLYLPFAHDSHLHFKGKIRRKFKNKINFIGSFDKQRLKFLKSLFTDEIFIAGNSWKNKIENYGDAIFGSKLNSIVSSSLASLNLLRDQNLTSHNMRTFEVPAMRGLLLTERSKEQNKFFPENKASLMFSNLRELKEKIIFIKKNRNLTKKIRDNGYKISKEHTYTKRAVYLLENIFND